MKFEINIPHHYDIKSVKDIKRQSISKAKIENNTLNAIVETKNMGKEYSKALQTKFVYKKQKFSAFINKIEGIDLFPLTKKIRTFEDAVILTGLLNQNLNARGVEGRNGFTDFLGANYLFKNPIKSCGAVATLTTSLLRELGVETNMIRGVMLITNKSKVYQSNKIAEHAWNSIKIPKYGTIEVDFARGDTYLLPNENYIATIQVKDPADYLIQHLEFSKIPDYTLNSLKVIK